MVCPRCGEHEAPDDKPYCVPCSYALRKELDEALKQVDAALDLFGALLARHALFEEWCAAAHLPNPND